MGLFKIWKDHVTQYSNRYREVQNADGTITHEAVEGEVVQELSLIHISEPTRP